MKNVTHKFSKEDVVLDVKSLDGGRVELVKIDPRQDLYVVRYKGFVALPPTSFRVANRYLWNEFLD
jgi:hypothetical protein